MSEKDGGPISNLTIRDYIAISSMNAQRIAQPETDPEVLAEWSYADADAMLSERSKP
jgi:hypothetical protein